MVKSKKILKSFMFLIVITLLSGSLFACEVKEPLKETPERYKTQDWTSDSEYNLDNDIATVVYKLSDNRPLRVLQLTDIHYDDHNSKPEKRRAVLNMIEELILTQKPHIVTLTGDWSSNSFNLLEGEYDKYALLYPEIVLDRNTPKGEIIKGLKESRSRELFDRIDSACDTVEAIWAPVFGNHDAEGDLSKYDYADIFKEYKNCVFKTGYQNLKGVGNYIIAVKQNDNLVTAIYMLDSHSALKYGSSEYDALGQSQIDWFLQTNRDLTSIYKSGGGADKSIPSAIYQHIALSEYDIAYKKAVGNQNLIIGGNREKVSKPYANTGMFSAIEKVGGVNAVFAGHDHDNNSASKYKNVILAFGVQSGWCDEYATGSQKGALIAEYQGNKVLITHIYKQIFDFQDSVI